MRRRAAIALLALLALLPVALSVGCRGQTADAARPISNASGKGGHDGTGGAKAESPPPTTSRTTSRESSGLAGSKSGAEASVEARAMIASSTDTRTTGIQAGTTTQASPDTTSRTNSARTTSSLPAPILKTERSPNPFVEDPSATGGSGYEANSVLDVRHGRHAGYERVVIDLGAGKMPADKVPQWTLSSPSGDGLLRITFPSINATKTPDGNLGGSLVKSFHVVRAPEGGMFVDVLARSAFTYRVLELSNPARLVVDFKPSDAKLKVPLPAAGGNTVLTQPRAGAKVDGMLLVSGYSRNPEATNTIILKGSGGKVLLRENVRSNDWSATWGYFETTLDPPPFKGEATLQVGAASPKDGSLKGVSVPIQGG